MRKPSSIAAGDRYVSSSASRARSRNVINRRYSRSGTSSTKPRGSTLRTPASRKIRSM
jgi:hypothetical protein